MSERGWYDTDSAPNYQIQFTPRETVEHEWDVDSTRVANEHEITVARLNVDAKRQLFMMQREEATKSRLHAEHMKEVDLEIRKLDVKLRSWFKIPILIIKLPVLILLGIAYIASVVTGHEIKGNDFWRFINQ